MDSPDQDGSDLPVKDRHLRTLSNELLPNFRALTNLLANLDDAEEIKEVSDKLKRTARHIRFILGRPEKQPHDLVDQVISLFRQAGDQLLFSGPHLRGIVTDSTAMHHRADSIENRLIDYRSGE